MGFDLVRMVRSVQTKRMRGRKGKIGWPEEFKYEFLVNTLQSYNRSSDVDDHLLIFKHVPMNDETLGRHTVILSTCKILLVECFHFLLYIYK